MTVFAAVGGSWILMGVLIVLFLGVVYGFYTREGSGIATHPTDGRGQAPRSEQSPSAGDYSWVPRPLLMDGPSV